MQKVRIEFVKGKLAPRYDSETWPDRVLELKGAVITENGMKSGYPCVDLQFVDRHGKMHVAVVTGALLQAIGGAISGVNMRNHGHPEPDSVTAVFPADTETPSGEKLH